LAPKGQAQIEIAAVGGINPKASDLIISCCVQPGTYCFYPGVNLYGMSELVAVRSTRQTQ